MSEKSYTKYIGIVLDDRYQILEKIGQGGMAVVFRAIDLRLNREVAIKIIRDELFRDADMLRRFYAEAHAVAQLSHPGIVAVYDVSQNENVGYLVMELISGITLKQYIDRKKAVLETGCPLFKADCGCSSAGARAWNHSPGYQTDEYHAPPERNDKSCRFRNRCF